ncbi:MAG TPA: phage holin family protein [Solirubrobacteraceae bacterium]
MSATGDSRTADDLRDQSIGELVKDLATETSTLVRQEIDLAKAEMTERGKRAGKGAAMLGAAALVGLLAAGALTACMIAALDRAMATWLAALVVTVVYCAIAGALAMTGRKQMQEAAPPVPEQAIDSVKEDVQWAKTRTRSATK